MPICEGEWDCTVEDKIGSKNSHHTFTSQAFWSLNLVNIFILKIIFKMFVHYDLILIRKQHV